MREIKFRAWDIYFKRMFNVKRLEWLPSGDINVVLDDKEESYSDGCELMQYTGLKDKNGKEIYEGDILDIGEPQVKKRSFGTVSFQDGYFGYNAPWLVGEQKPIPLKEYCNEIFQPCVEVVGNIYENPDLIKT